MCDIGKTYDVLVCVCVCVCLSVCVCVYSVYLSLCMRVIPRLREVLTLSCALFDQVLAVIKHTPLTTVR